MEKIFSGFKKELDITGDFDYKFIGIFDNLIRKPERPESMVTSTMNNVSGLYARGNLLKSSEEGGIMVAVDHKVFWILLLLEKNKTSCVGSRRLRGQKDRGLPLVS